MTAPQFSVIMPTYNRRHCLATAIASVLKQTIQDYELLIVDDCSTDGTAEWLNETYSPQDYPQIRLITLSKNKGAAGARNVALAQAKGEWIAFLDSDDEWQSTFLEAHAQAFASHPNAAFSACDLLNKSGKNGEIQQIVQSKVWSIYPDAISHMLMSSLIWSMSLVVVSHRCLKQAGFLNEALKICEDREFYLRLLAYGEYVHVPQTLVVRTQGEDSLTKDIGLYAREVIRAIDQFLDTPEGLPYRHLRRTAKSRWSMNVARKIFEEKQNPLLAYYLLAQAFFFAPHLTWGAIQRRL